MRQLGWLLALFLNIQLTQACTDFQLKANDSTLLITRSMEFGVPVDSNLRTALKEQEKTSPAPDGGQGLSWKNKYGYLYLDGFNSDLVIDDMNEAGLAFEYLYLPGDTQYPAAPSDKKIPALSYVDFGAWILGNFKTIEELKTALKTIKVFQGPPPGMPGVVLPAHAAIHDAKGNGLVVEFIHGQLLTYPYLGVMTNSPTYDWQVRNLSNYLNLTPYNPEAIIQGDFVFSVTGQGAGMVGLPGDVSPPSRFVKTAFMTKYVYPAKDVHSVVNLAEHIINNFDIPDGLARSKSNNKTSSDTTEWVVFKDLTHKKLYYRTYDNLNLRVIDLTKLDFSSKGPELKMSIQDPPKLSNKTKLFKTFFKH